MGQEIFSSQGPSEGFLEREQRAAKRDIEEAAIKEGGFGCHVCREWRSPDYIAGTVKLNLLNARTGDFEGIARPMYCKTCAKKHSVAHIRRECLKNARRELEKGNEYVRAD